MWTRARAITHLSLIYRRSFARLAESGRHFRLHSAIAQSTLSSTALVCSGTRTPARATTERRGRVARLFPAQFRHHRKVSVNQRLNEFAPYPRERAGGRGRGNAGFTPGYLYESRGDTPLLSHLSRGRDGVKSAGQGVDGWLACGAGQEVVAKSPLTSDWHAPETGRAAPEPPPPLVAARYDC